MMLDDVMNELTKVRHAILSRSKYGTSPQLAIYMTHEAYSQLRSDGRAFQYISIRSYGDFLSGAQLFRVAVSPEHHPPYRIMELT